MLICIKSMTTIIYLAVIEIQRLVAYHCLSIQDLIIYLGMISAYQLLILWNHNILKFQIANVIQKIFSFATYTDKLINITSGNVEDLLRYLTSLLYMTQGEKKSYLFFEFNINLLATNKKIPSDFFSPLASYFMLPLIDKPTRITSNSVTLINKIFINCSCFRSGILVSDLSDHFPILYIKLTN